MALCKDIKPVYGCKTPGMRNNFLPDPNADPPGATHHQRDLCKNQKTSAPSPVAPTGGLIVQKNKIVFDESVYDDAVADQLRKSSGLYWVTGEQRNLNSNEIDKITQYFALLDKSEKIKKGNLEQFNMRVGNLVQGNDVVDASRKVYGERKVDITIEPMDSKGRYSASTWTALINRLEARIKDKIYYDHVFMMQLPYDERDLKQFTAIQQDRSRASFNFEYNYYIKEYEELLLSRQTPPHRLLPHLYAFESERYNRRAEAIDSRNLIKAWRFLTIEERLNFIVSEYGVSRTFAANRGMAFDAQVEAAYNKKYPQSVRQLSKAYPGFGAHINLAASSFQAFGKFNPPVFPVDAIYVPDSEKFNYFQKWTTVYKSIINNFPAWYTYLGIFDRKYQNTAITTDNFEELCLPSDGFNSKRELFPMFVQMRFPTDIRGSHDSKQKLNATDLIDTTNLSIPFIGYIMETLDKDAKFKSFQDALEKERMSLQAKVNAAGLGLTSAATVDASYIGGLVKGAGKAAPGSMVLGAGFGLINLPLTNVINFYENTIASSYRTIVQFPSNVQKGARRVWNLMALMELYNKFEVTKNETLENPNATKIFDGRDLDIGIVLGTYPIDIRKFSSKQYKLLKSLWLFLFSTGLKDLLKVGKLDAAGKKQGGLMRSFEEMLQGRPAESETVFYRIEKRFSGSGTAIQNFYIPNNSEIDVAEWVDTQVKYNEEYIYQVYAYQLVYGTAYDYEGIKSLDSRNRTATFTAKYRPSLVLVEEPFFSTRGKILDSPPVDPDVDIVSFVDDNSKIMINLTSNTGDRYMEPLIIDSFEEDYINSLPSSIARFITTYENNEIVTKFKVRYKNDDPIDTYAVYKIDKKPTSYSDFAGASTLVKSTVGGTSATFIDEDIVPNKKYYYVFRSVDRHGHVSYPSAIYEAEMVDEAGTIYLDVRTINLREDEFKTHSKQMKRYLMISPAAAQSVVDLKNTSGFEQAKDKSADSLRDVKLGIREKSIYGKKYKIRLTSKSTGRKIDINVRFNKEHKKLPKVEYEPPAGKLSVGKPIGGGAP